MKIYDIVSHRTYEVSPESINVYATRKSKCNVVYLHECADKYDTPQCSGTLYVSEKVWKKIANRHRKSW